MSVSDAKSSSRMPVEAKDSMRRRGRAVVLLKDVAGVTQEGSLKKRVTNQPRSIEERA